MTTKLIDYCAGCNTGFERSQVAPCPVCTLYGGKRPNVPGIFAVPPKPPGPRRRKNTARPSIGARLFVMARDGYKCVACGTQDNLTMDHIIPRSKGGKNVRDNLQTMCAPCNQAKGSTVPE